MMVILKKKNRQFIATDVNNDGLTDIIEASSVNAPQLGLYNENFLSIRKASIGKDGNVKFDTREDIDLDRNYSIGNWNEQKEAPCVIDFDGDGNPELMVPDINVYKDEEDGKKHVNLRFIGGSLDHANVTYKLQNTEEFPLYGVGDFNNDGKGDVVMVETEGPNGYYSGIIEGYNSGTTLYSDTLKLSLPSKPEKLFAQDFNNDGLIDILLFYNGGYTVFWNQGYGLTNMTFSTNNKTVGTNIGDTKLICQGDFNGDGLIDFLLSNTDDSLYHIAYNNGNGIFTKRYACTLNVYDQTLDKISDDSKYDYDDDKFQISVCDFDNDGKSDVIINKPMYRQGKNFKFKKTYTYWMRSTGSGLEQVKVATSKRENDGLACHYLIGDFSGNSQVELINYGYDCLNGNEADSAAVWHYYHNVGYTVNSGKIKTITNGFGSKTDIAYAPMADTNIYTKGTKCKYPMADYQIPMHLVKAITADNGAAQERVMTNYKYSGLKVHLQGKGFLGMDSQTAENTTLGVITETGIKSWNTTFFMPSQTYTETTITSSGEISSTTTNTAFADKGNRRYFAYPSSVNTIDYDENGIKVTNEYNIDSCYLKSQTTQYGGDMSTNKAIYYTNYVLAGGVYKPQLVTTIQKHEDADEEYKQKTSYTYDVNNGLLTREIDHYDSSLPVTKDYTYDNFGNQISSVSTGTGIIPLTLYTEYDDSKRFATKKYTSPISLTNTFTYDIWGNMLTENNETNPSSVLTTTHVYNNWGEEISNTSPIGLTTNYSRNWNDDPTSGYYIYTHGEAQPWVKVSYDNEGRELQKETVGEKGITIKETNTYNSKAQVISKCSVNGDLKETEDFTYDGRGRILTDDNHNRQKTTFSYRDSKSKIVYFTIDQKESMKQYDVWGNVKISRISSDPTNTVYYTYNSMGKPVLAQAYNNEVTMSYDDAGNQTSLNDPDAGTTTYVYDAAGRVTRQQDARGIVTTNSYDFLGRLTSSSVGDINTTYTYGTSGNEALHLTQKKAGNNYVNYTYDAYGRVIKETRNVKDNGTYDYTYSYNDKGELSQKVYPSGLTVKYSYDDYGNHVKTYTDEQTIWELTNKTGTITTSVIGDSITTTETHNDKGLLTNLKAVCDTSTLYNMNFSFNPTTGNLMSRTGMMDNTETFAYDSIDRLTNVIKSNTNVMAMTYNENGNIISKTGVGTYSYGTTKLDAVISVDNTDGSISSDSLRTEYNAFGKIMAITNSDHKLRMSFSYGPDQDRWSSEIKNDSITSRYVMYGDDFDNITINGETRTIYYLDGGAIYIQEVGKEGKLYYACTDNLGSIVRIVDMSGHSVFEASYDVWGKQTVKKNDISFYRGYTGHEHIPEFGLINMNGRMYDSALGRFLSPDDHVQLPDLCQNYNRFSYCLNNPLKYTDPSGEIIGIDDAFVIAGVMALGGGLNWAFNGCQFNLKGLAYFAVGATGALMSFAGPLGWVAGGALVGTANAALNGASASQIFTSGMIGAASGLAGGYASELTSGLTLPLLKSIESPVEQQALSGMITGSAGGYVGGFTSGYLATGDLEKANDYGLQGLSIGGITGTAEGALSGYRSAVKNGINPITGDPTNIKLARLKGLQGIEMAKEVLRARGIESFSQEVTIEADNIRVRIDIVYKSGDEIHLVEVKNGPHAGYTKNQRQVYPKMKTTDGDKVLIIPRGKKAMEIWPTDKIGVPTNKYYFEELRFNNK
jgi:RHS repeat-associated protein